MAIGFTPKHEEEFTLDGLTQEQFLVLAIEAAKEMQCEVGSISDSGFIAYTSKGLFTVDAEIKLIIANGAATLKSASTGGEIMDWGRNKKNIEKFIAVFDELKPTFTQEELALKYEELKKTFATEGEMLPSPTAEKITGLFSIFTPTEGYFFTPILINLNILVFILMVITGVDIFQPDSTSLIAWGANFRPITLEGQWWRLFTCCFLHIGVFHLLFNMYALLYIGLILEPLLGKLRFIAAYILTGIAASVVSLWWHDEFVVSAGASGAIFGMYGVFLAMLTTNLIEKTARRNLLTSIGVFVLYNLMNGLKSGIDNSAHIGGLLCGLAIGYAYYNTLHKQVAQKTITKLVATLAFIVFAGTYIVCKETPNDIAEYDSKIQTFATLEKKALDVLNMPPTTSNQQYLDALKNEGIINWNKCIVLLKELDELSIPNGAHDRNEKLIEYCELRIKSYTLMGKAIQEGISKYDDSLKIYQENIEDIIRNLSENENTSGVRERKSPSTDVKEYYDENPLPEKPQ